MSRRRSALAAVALVIAAMSAACDIEIEPLPEGDKTGRDRKPATHGKARPVGVDNAEPRQRKRDRPQREKAPVAPEPEVREFLVVRVVDGDTIELGNGETVRLVGIDTPEVGECGFEKSAARLGELVAGQAVRLGESDEDRDQYDRLLRYVDIGAMDAGYRLIRDGLAIARYDSRDGHGRHPREDAYIAADRRSVNVSCAPEPRSFADTGGGGNCDPSYSPCVPLYPPDLDCADTGPVTVHGSDPHGLDADGTASPAAATDSPHGRSQGAGGSVRRSTARPT